MSALTAFLWFNAGAFVGYLLAAVLGENQRPH
jgi:hypothetical protein